MEYTNGDFPNPETLHHDGFQPFRMLGQRFYHLYGGFGTPIAGIWFAYVRTEDSMVLAFEAMRGPSREIILKGEWPPRKYDPNGGALGRPQCEKPKIYTCVDSELMRAIDSRLPGPKLDPTSVHKCPTCRGDIPTE